MSVDSVDSEDLVPDEYSRALDPQNLVSGTLGDMSNYHSRAQRGPGVVRSRLLELQHFITQQLEDCDTANITADKNSKIESDIKTMKKSELIAYAKALQIDNLAWASPTLTIAQLKAAILDKSAQNHVAASGDAFYTPVQTSSNSAGATAPLESRRMHSQRPAIDQRLVADQDMIVLGNVVECEARLAQPITLLSVRRFLVDVKNYEHRYSREVNLYHHLSREVINELYFAKHSFMDGIDSIRDRGPWTKTQVLNLISAVLQQQGITPLQAAALAAKLPYPSAQQWQYQKDLHSKAAQQLLLLPSYLETLAEFDAFITDMLSNTLIWPSSRDHNNLRPTRLHEVLESKLKEHAENMWSVLAETFFNKKKAPFRELLHAIQVRLDEFRHDLAVSRQVVESLTARIKPRTFEQDKTQDRVSDKQSPVKQPDQKSQRLHNLEVHSSELEDIGELEASDDDEEGDRVEAESVVLSNTVDLAALTLVDPPTCFQMLLYGVCDKKDCKFSHTKVDLARVAKLVAEQAKRAT